MSAASIAAELEGVGGSACQCSDHTNQITFIVTSSQDMCLDE